MMVFLSPSSVALALRPDCFGASFSSSLAFGMFWFAVRKFIYLSLNLKSSRTDHTWIFIREKY